MFLSQLFKKCQSCLASLARGGGWAKRNPSGEAGAVSQIVRFVRETAGLAPIYFCLYILTVSFQSLPKDYSHCCVKLPGLSLSIPTKGLFPLLRGALGARTKIPFNPYQRIIPIVTPDSQGKPVKLSILTKGLFPLSLSPCRSLRTDPYLSIPTKGLFPLLRKARG